jgi:tripeptide aminopeptidase
MLSISGGSGQERLVAEFITEQLRESGVPASAIRSDQAHRRSPVPGEVGNLICRLPGTQRGPRRLLMAHMDTVALCEGAVPLVQGNFVFPRDPQTALGADDRAGAAVVLWTAMEILRRKLPHPPLTFLWSIQEEVGLFGAHFGQLGLLGKPRLAFNFDGGAAEKVTVGATGGYRMQIHVEGIASHAGVSPENGVSAIAIAALAIAQLHQDGWHGLVQKGGRRGTSNIGVIQGGEATNVVAPRVELRAEARGHDAAFRGRIIRAIEQSFQKAARSVRNAAGRGGKVTLEGQLQYESFRLPDDDPSVLAAEAAIRAEGGQPYRALSNGGLDANWMSARGIPTVTLGCGQSHPHTTEERLDLEQYRLACRVALRLATPVVGRLSAGN